MHFDKFGGNSADCGQYLRFICDKRGGSSSGGFSTPKNPTVDGKTQTMTNVAGDIAKLSEGKFETIDLNGTTSVPVDVIKAIATSNAEVTLKQIQLLKKCPYLKTRVFA